jgi:T4 RnlA family RNA ligase
MRGTTFVFNLDGTLWKRFLMLPKFFNLNQVESTQYGAVKDKKIRSITVKEDGSLVAFMHLPNGKLFAKTQGGFSNEQAVVSMDMIEENKDLNEFVHKYLEMGYTPLFEYVSFDNRIVLQYHGRELKLIGLINNDTEEYTCASTWDKTVCSLNIPFVKSEPIITLDELILRAMTEKDVEGWVVEFEDGQMIKLKTQWYFMLHGIRTENIFREDYVIRNYLLETLDDLVSQLNPIDDKDAFRFVEVVKLAVDNKIKDIDDKVNALYDRYNTVYEKNWSKFATNEHKNAHFSLMKTFIEKPEHFNKKRIEYIISQTKHLQDAKFFVSKWSGVAEKFVTKWNKEGTK